MLSFKRKSITYFFWWFQKILKMLSYQYMMTRQNQAMQQQPQMFAQQPQRITLQQINQEIQNKSNEIIIKPEFIKGKFTMEAFKNKSVEQAIKLMAKRGLKMTNYNYEICLSEINRYLDIYTKSQYQYASKRVSSVGNALICEEYSTPNPAIKAILHKMNCFISHVETTNFTTNTMFSGAIPDDYNTQLKRDLGFTFDQSIFGKDIKESFSKLWTFNTHLVNFEHVCAIVAYLLVGADNVNKEHKSYIMHLFLMLLSLYVDKYNFYRFFILHLVKLIRIHYTRPAEGEEFYSPFTYMTNLSYGSYKDANVEIYGDTRLTKKENCILKLFSLAPRSVSTATHEDTIWFNWNSATALNLKLTERTFDIHTYLFGRNADNTENLHDIFAELTRADVLYRKDLAKIEYLNIYNRAIVGKDATQDDIVNAIVYLIKSHTEINDFSCSEQIKGAKIGITYKTEENTVISYGTNITLGTLLEYVQNYKAIELKNIKLEEYIVKCFINEHGNICRNEYTAKDEKFAELREEAIELEQNAFNY